MARWRLISDGTSQGTRLIDNETGYEVPNISYVCFDISCGEPSKITIDLIDVECVVETDDLEQN